MEPKVVKIKNIQANASETVDVLVTGITEKLTRSNKAFCVITVTDGDSTAEVKLWNNAKKDLAFHEGSVLTMYISGQLYDGSMSYVCSGYRESRRSPEEFVTKVPEDIQKMWDALYPDGKSIYEYQDKDIEILVADVLGRYKEKLMYWAAAKGMHHAIYGGLLYHMYRMALSAVALAPVYPQINADILVAGTILHDIGKVEELDTTMLGTSEYTVKGRLMGHMYIGMEIVSKIAEENCIPPNITEQILHIIASHHGKQEWGALVPPATMEAQVVHYLDMIDSRLYMYEDAYKDKEPGLTDKVFGLGNVTLYKPM